MKQKFSFGFEKFSALYIWAALILIFALWIPNLFLTTTTMQTIASSQVVTALLAISVVIPLAAGRFDLSVGATVNLAAILVVVLQTVYGWGLVPAVVVSLLAGVLIGALNALLVVGLGISSFIATLGVGTILAAVQTIVSNNAQPFAPSDPLWNALTRTPVFGVPVLVFYLLIIALIVWWMLSRTPFGRYLYAIGGNEDAARLSGVRTGRYVSWSLVLSAGLAAFAGVIYASYSGPSLTFGPSLLLPAFAAAFLGSTQLTPGRFNVWGSLIAVYMLATGVQGLQFVTGVSWLGDMFNGVALILAVGFAASRGRARRRGRRREAFEKQEVSRPSPSDDMEESVV